MLKRAKIPGATGLKSALIGAFMIGISGSAFAGEHPLDGLTADEIKRVVSILKNEKQAADGALFSLIELVEPDKSFVLAWKEGEAIPRKAMAHYRSNGALINAIVDINAGKVESTEPLKGQPMILLAEFISSMEAALGDEIFIEGLAKRGLKPADVFCLPLTAGNFGVEGEAGKRLMKVPCYANPSGSNFYAKPIEGLFATVDLTTKRVLEVIDEKEYPIPEDDWGYTEAELEKRFGALRPKTNPATLQQPGGANFKIDGSGVTWDMWSFRYRTDKRPGVVLSEIKVKDGDKERSVLYQAHLSEVFVPYMDPDAGWYWRTYMDSGEYGFGIFLSPLRAGVDCPDYATFLPAVVHQDNGEPLEIPGAICIFERNIGDPAWRHFEVFAQSEDQFTPTEGRPDTQLVVRSASEVGNYDYLIDYVFHQNGRLDIMVGSTGLDAVKGASITSMNDANAAEETKYGTLIAPYLVAPNHDHFFNFRLDFDIDGRANTFMRTALVPGKPDEKALRRSYWVTETTPVKNEMDGRFRVNPATPAMYHIMNMSKESALGHKPGYMIAPNNSVAYGPLDVKNDPPMKRNAYIDYTIWNTAYQPKERYAGGEFAFASDGSDTLATWVERNKPLEGQDIVTWYTMGFHHIPKMEDWPVMSTMWKGIYLMPFNYFANNPAATIRMPEKTASQ